MKRRRIAAALAHGETTSAAARQFHVIPGRVSQVRRELAEAWERFQAEPVADLWPDGKKQVSLTVERLVTG